MPGDVLTDWGEIIRKFKTNGELLQKKWGKDIVRKDKGSKKEFDYNPIIRVPIDGV